MLRRRVTHQFKQLMRDLAAGKAGNTLMALACVLFLSAQTNLNASLAFGDEIPDYHEQIRRTYYQLLFR